MKIKCTCDCHKEEKKEMKKTSIKTKSKSKRPVNKFFKIMLDAKKNGKKSFKYNGFTYVGTKHDKLGMIYKKKE